MLDLAYIIFGGLTGMGLSWAAFRSDLYAQAADLDAADADLAEARAYAGTWRRRALDAEANLELLLADGARNPLTAPVEVLPVNDFIHNTGGAA